MSVSSSYAKVMHLFPSIADEVLSETVPTAFAPLDLEIEDFAVFWKGPIIPGVEFYLEPNSLQWVRVQEILVIPRARMIVKMQGVQNGQVSNTGFTTIAEIENREGFAELLVPLLSGEKNLILIQIKRDGVIYQGQLQIQFKKKLDHSAQNNRVGIDPSCSQFDLKEKLFGESPNDWIYIGCRLGRAHDVNSRTSSLEVYIFWDNVGENIELDGILTPSTSSSIWALRLKPGNHQVNLKAGNRHLQLSYSAKKELKDGSFGLGVGPYDYRFQGNGEYSETIEALLNLYSSYFLSETMRVLAFGSTTLDHHNFTDLGLYLCFENYRILDRRVGINFLLGVHAIGFRSSSQFYFVSSFPQGVEAVVYDAFTKNRNLTLGAFIYPEIGGNAYYNMWLRWGNKIYMEIDYYLWQAAVEETQFTNGSLGISFGFPLGEF